MDALTQRENDVANLVARGWTNKEIAQSIGIGKDTVKQHLSRVFEKKAVRNRVELAIVILKENGSEQDNSKAEE